MNTLVTGGAGFIGSHARAGVIGRCIADVSPAEEVRSFRARCSLEDGLPDRIESRLDERPPDHEENGLDKPRAKELVP